MRVMFTMLIVFLSFIILELVSRLVLHYIYNRKFDFSIIEKNKYGNSNGIKANQEVIIWGKKFTTDNFGSRPATVKTSLPKKLYIGDSVLEGVGVEDSSIFTTLLQFSDSQSQYLNLSLSGNSSWDYENIVSAVTDSNSSTFIPAIQSISIVYCLNDIYGKTSAQDLPTMSSGFIAQCNLMLQHISVYRLIKLMIFNNTDNYFRYDEQFYHQDEKVRESINYLARIKNICTSKKIAFQVIIMPYKSQFKTKQLFPQQTLAYHLGINGISFIDIFQKLEKKEKVKDLYLFADEIHFSTTGHKAIADALKGI